MPFKEVSIVMQREEFCRLALSPWREREGALSSSGGSVPRRVTSGWIGIKRLG